jgi:transcriptional regulator with XRE-family HTH domain
MMSFRSWRERQLLSQERVAEMSGLSLRTIQRLEAGHRVSYASLRALATAFEVDVDSLERELYAMNRSADDFIEIPRWVRRLNDAFWFGGLRASRRDIRLLEGLLVGCGAFFFVASFVVTSEAIAKLFRASAFFELLLGYYVSVASRVIETYKLWPVPEGSSQPSQPIRRTWRRITAEYAFLFGVGIVGTVAMCWLLF